MLDRSLDALREDYFQRGWKDRYELMVGVLLQREDEVSLDQLGARGGRPVGTLRVMLPRMRVHYRAPIERELGRTLHTDEPKLIRREMTELLQAFA